MTPPNTPRDCPTPYPCPLLSEERVRLSQLETRVNALEMDTDEAKQGLTILVERTDNMNRDLGKLTNAVINGNGLVTQVGLLRQELSQHTRSEADRRQLDAKNNAARTSGQWTFWAAVVAAAAALGSGFLTLIVK